LHKSAAAFHGQFPIKRVWSDTLKVRGQFEGVVQNEVCEKASSTLRNDKFIGTSARSVTTETGALNPELNVAMLQVKVGVTPFQGKCLLASALVLVSPVSMKFCDAVEQFGGVGAADSRETNRTPARTSRVTTS